jgi:hypothetical protein
LVAVPGFYEGRAVVGVFDADGGGDERGLASFLVSIVVDDVGSESWSGTVIGVGPGDRLFGQRVRVRLLDLPTRPIAFARFESAQHLEGVAPFR